MRKKELCILIVVLIFFFNVIVFVLKSHFLDEILYNDGQFFIDCIDDEIIACNISYEFLDAINRLETMMLMNDMELPVSAIRNYIEKAIDIVIQIDRLSDGKRKITSISEVVGMKNDKISMKEIFSFKENGLSEQGNVRGEFVVYKYVPQVYDRMKRKGIILNNIL